MVAVEDARIGRVGKRTRSCVVTIVVGCWVLDRAETAGAGGALTAVAAVGEVAETDVAFEVAFETVVVAESAENVVVIVAVVVAVVAVVAVATAVVVAMVAVVVAAVTMTAALVVAAVVMPMAVMLKVAVAKVQGKNFLVLVDPLELLLLSFSVTSSKKA